MNRLKDIRKGQGKTQKDLATLLGVTEMTISRWEKMKELSIKHDQAQQLADYFGVSVGYLLGYEVIDIMDTTYLEDYIFFKGDYSNPDKTREEYFEKISQKIELYKEVAHSLYGRYNKEKAFQALEILEENGEDDLDDIFEILSNKLELALYKYIAQYQLLLPRFQHLNKTDEDTDQPKND